MSCESCFSELPLFFDGDEIEIARSAREPQPAARSEASTTARVVLRLYMPAAMSARGTPSRTNCAAASASASRMANGERLLAGVCSSAAHGSGRSRGSVPVPVASRIAHSRSCSYPASAAATRYFTDRAGAPVQWQEWGDAAFERAKKEKRPIFLSIGFAPRGECQRMHREAFLNGENAEALNAYFVPVLLDRIEYPEVAEAYEAVARSMDGVDAAGR